MLWLWLCLFLFVGLGIFELTCQRVKAAVPKRSPTLPQDDAIMRAASLASPARMRSLPVASREATHAQAGTQPALLVITVHGEWINIRAKHNVATSSALYRGGPNSHRGDFFCRWCRPHRCRCNLDQHDKCICMWEQTRGSGWWLLRTELPGGLLAAAAGHGSPFCCKPARVIGKGRQV